VSDKATIAAYKERERQLIHIIKQTMWMARRYAGGRMTYAPGMYNEAATLALDLGVISVADFGFDAEIFASEPTLPQGN
jgi:hypothetical protein